MNVKCKIAVIYGSQGTGKTSLAHFLARKKKKAVKTTWLMLESEMARLTGKEDIIIVDEFPTDEPLRSINQYSSKHPAIFVIVVQSDEKPSNKGLITTPIYLYTYTLHIDTVMFELFEKGFDQEKGKLLHAYLKTGEIL